jgi:hypothetical protein
MGLTTSIRRCAAAAVLILVCALEGHPAAQNARAIPRMPDGRPNLQGIWQVRNRASYDLQDHVARHAMPAGRSVVDGLEIPYQPWAAARKIENFTNRATADPLAQCYMPGVPRIMYMEWPFQIFQTRDHVAMIFEWSQVHRLIYTNGTPHEDRVTFWMGDSRGRWDGDTLVVDVKSHNDKTWFDMAGNFHSEALHVVERYTLVDADTMQYEVTIDDPKVFTRPWKISMPLHRHTSMDRILEYQCQAEKEEANGDFEREPRTWYPGPNGPKPPATFGPPPQMPTTSKAPASVRRTADGKPDLSGFFQADHGGANWGLETHEATDKGLNPAGRGVVIDPPDGKLPYQPWAREEQLYRNTPIRGYDDPTAHCFVAGVPRSMYVPAPLHIIQTPDAVVLLHERMSWRLISFNRKSHLPDHMRLWQGDSIGRWDGDTLVVETTNLNGKTWASEVGDVVSHAQHVIERFTPVDADTISWEATITDPIVYTRPFTIGMPFKRQPSEMLEVACREGDRDLPILKHVRDVERAKLKAAPPTP